MSGLVVYVAVVDFGYDGEAIIGVYATPEKARQACEEWDVKDPSKARPSSFKWHRFTDLYGPPGSDNDLSWVARHRGNDSFPASQFKNVMVDEYTVEEWEVEG